MTDTVRITLKLIAGFMDYPGTPAFKQRVHDRYPIAQECCPELAKMLEVWQDNWDRLEEAYVATFDLSETAALYLTAHEFGDSRARGPALIQIGQLLSDAGYGVALGELPDYLPLLIEWLAVSPDSKSLELKDRVAAVAQKILQVLTDGHPYRPLFVMLNEALGGGGSPLSADVGERPDLDDLPFPLEFTSWGGAL